MRSYLFFAVCFLLIGHYLRILRWEKFIRPYERPPVRALFRALALGYGLNLFLPARIGDIFRAAYIGRKLHNGMGFGLATVILDRFLDLIAMAVLLLGFRLCGVDNEEVRQSARIYGLLIFTTGVLLVGCRVCGSQAKRSAVAFCSLFNERIKLEGMKFFWSLFNALRDLSKIDFLEVFATTVLMWAAYLASYQLFALSLATDGARQEFLSVFFALFSGSNLGVTALAISQTLGGGVSGLTLQGCVYTLVPIIMLWGCTLLPFPLRQRLGRTAVLSRDREGREYISLLPQVDEADQGRFLMEYFSATDGSASRKFIELNRDVSILRDYSAGSNATTMLCMNSKGTFYRKYAFGLEGEKLRRQLLWLQGHQDCLPLCEIIGEEYGEGCCCYDMSYDCQATDFFSYIHSRPLGESWAVLESVLQTLEQKLYKRKGREADGTGLTRYIEQKVVRNLATIKDAPLLAPLLGADHVLINGRRYKNLPLLEGLLQPDYLLRVFAADPYSDIHGDLTIENIICQPKEAGQGEGYYLIDPNPGNSHESPYLDLAKLLQSLHGGYEFMMLTKAVQVSRGAVDFLYTRSAAYDALLERFGSYLAGNYSNQAVRSIFHHELVHWLRLLPYKLRRDKQRVPMFYAGLIMVANDVEEWYGKDA